MTGDLNVAHQPIDVFDPKGKEKIAGYTPEERESFDNFLKQGFVDTFRHLYPEKKQFSFWSARSGARKEDKGWRLDYFVINKEDADMVLDSTIHGEYHGSDHCPIQLRLKLSKSDEKKEDVSDDLEEEVKSNHSKSKKRSTSATQERRKSLKMSPKKRRSKSKIPEGHQSQDEEEEE